MKLQKIKVAGVDINKIIQDDTKYEDEVLGAAIDAVKQIASQAYELKKILEGRLIYRLEKTEATKLPFINNEGISMMATLKKGATKCINKEADLIYKKNGFKPEEIGEYVFKPSWTKAKEAMKLGKLKKELIERFFGEGESTLEIKEIKK